MNEMRKDQKMSGLYLVKDGDRTVVLAAERDGRIYGYIPNVDAFVYNKPMSVDFLIDRDMDYEPVTASDAADIIAKGVIGKINGRTNKFLLDEMKAETKRIQPAEVLRANDVSDPEPTRTQIANAKAALLKKTPLGEWIPYRTHSRSKRQTAQQMASDLRNRKIQAFRDIAVQTRVVENEDGDYVVQISRSKVGHAESGKRKSAAAKSKSERAKPAPIRDRRQPRTRVARERRKLITELSGREREVLELLLAGSTKGDVAARLLVSRSTVQSHVSRVIEKLKLNVVAKASNTASSNS
jgi:DNA-binding NarL/FixJ family response regulator